MLLGRYEVIDIEADEEDCFSPNMQWNEGIGAHNRGLPRDSCRLKHPKAQLAFERGWDHAHEVQERIKNEHNS